MFDAIGVSERTRKPLTVTVSLTAQVAVVALAILIPMIGTEALPHRFALVDILRPPRGLPPRPVHPAGQRTPNFVPPQITPKGLVLPQRIPQRAILLQDPEIGIVAASGQGVAGGIGFPDGVPGGLEGVLPTGIAPPPPPAQPAKQPAQAALPKRIKLGGMVTQGKLISAPPPVYPILARQARVEGIVRLEAVITREGTILNLHAISGPPLLIRAAIEAVSKWTFQPTSLNGEPVEVATEIEVNFTLR